MPGKFLIAGDIPAEAVPFAAVSVLLLWFHRPAKWPPLTAPADGGAA